MAKAEDFRRGMQELRHPYSKALWQALPQNGFQPIPGFQPYAKYLTKAVSFLPGVPTEQKNVKKISP